MFVRNKEGRADVDSSDIDQESDGSDRGDPEARERGIPEDMSSR